MYCKSGNVKIKSASLQALLFAAMCWYRIKFKDYAIGSRSKWIKWTLFCLLLKNVHINDLTMDNIVIVSYTIKKLYTQKNKNKQLIFYDE